MTKKEVLKDVVKRVGLGESKKSIYCAYAMTGWEPIVVKRLALSVTLTNRRKWRRLNNALVGLYAVMVVMNVVAIAGFLTCSSLPERLGGLIGGSIGITINILVLVGLIRYNIVSHYALIFRNYCKV